MLYINKYDGMCAIWLEPWVLSHDERQKKIKLKTLLRRFMIHFLTKKISNV